MRACGGSPLCTLPLCKRSTTLAIWEPPCKNRTSRWSSTVKTTPSWHQTVTLFLFIGFLSPLSKQSVTTFRNSSSASSNLAQQVWMRQLNMLATAPGQRTCFLTTFNKPFCLWKPLPRIEAPAPPRMKALIPRKKNKRSNRRPTFFVWEMPKKVPYRSTL